MAKRVKLYTLPDREAYAPRLTRSEAGTRVTLESPELAGDVVPGPGGTLSILTSQGSFEAFVEREDDELVVTIENERFRFGLEAADGGARSARVQALAEVKAPMPGKVVEILKAPGDAVKAGEGVLLFEAMKMQNEIRSPQDGTLQSIDVAEGDAVEQRSRLFVVKGSGS